MLLIIRCENCDINMMMKVGIVTSWIPRPCSQFVGTSLTDEYTTLSSETQGRV